MEVSKPNLLIFHWLLALFYPNIHNITMYCYTDDPPYI